MASTSNPESDRIRFDSEIKSEKGLKCCEDSKAKIRSTDFLSKGNFVEEKLKNYRFC